MNGRHAAASERRHTGNGSANVAGLLVRDSESRQASRCAFSSGQLISLPMKKLYQNYFSLAVIQKIFLNM